MSDVRGRKALIRPALVLSAVGSLILILGVTGSVLVLAVGRFVVGAAIGLVMAAGAAWLQELSTGPPHVGARRATVFLSAGFGLGPWPAGSSRSFCRIRTSSPIWSTWCCSGSSPPGPGTPQAARPTLTPSGGPGSPAAFSHHASCGPSPPGHHGASAR
ncbi:hypothetical protein QP028_08170 [Corynebacterium suedekumii]|nr:hypothetical protein QP028_08170 [Corynebacterium suedekumii]